MFRKISVISLLLPALAASSFAAIRYEFRQMSQSGTETAEVRGKGLVDGPRSRIEFLKPPGYRSVSSYLISDGVKTLTIVDPVKKTYYNVDVQAMSSSFGAGKIEISNVATSITKLEDRPIIAGLATEHHRIDIKYDISVLFGSIPLKQAVETTIDTWATSALGEMGTAYTNEYSRTGNETLDRLIEVETTKIKGFILRQRIGISTISKDVKKNPRSALQWDPHRKQTTEMVVTSVQTVAVDNLSFALPAGFKRIDPSAEKQDANVHMLTLEPE